MLVLSRFVNESIIICDRDLNIIAEITVLEAISGRTRIGTAAGPDIKIHRREVYDDIVDSRR